MSGVTPSHPEEAASATSFKDLTPAIHAPAVTLAGFGQRDQTSGPQITCERGKADRRLKATRLLWPEGHFAGRQVFAQGWGSRPPTQSHPATLARRSFRWAPSLLLKAGEERCRDRPRRNRQGLRPSLNQKTEGQMAPAVSKETEPASRLDLPFHFQRCFATPPTPPPQWAPAPITVAVTHLAGVGVSLQFAPPSPPSPPLMPSTPPPPPIADTCRTRSSDRTELPAPPLSSRRNAAPERLVYINPLPALLEFCRPHGNCFATTPMTPPPHNPYCRDLTRRAWEMGDVPL